MKIKNNRKNFVSLQYKVGLKKNVYKFKPAEVAVIPGIIDMKQILNKFLFKNGSLSVVISNDIAIKEVAKVEKEVAKKATTKKATGKKSSKKSKVEEAIESADNFLSGDVNKDGVVDGEDLSIVHKAYSKANKSKNKKEEK